METPKDLYRTGVIAAIVVAVIVVIWRMSTRGAKSSFSTAGWSPYAVFEAQGQEVLGSYPDSAAPLSDKWNAASLTVARLEEGGSLKCDYQNLA